MQCQQIFVKSWVPVTTYKQCDNTATTQCELCQKHSCNECMFLRCSVCKKKYACDACCYNITYLCKQHEQDEKNGQKIK